MLDLIAIALLLVLFAMGFLYVRGCAALKDGR